MTPVNILAGIGKTTSNQQAVGGLHHRNNQIEDYFEEKDLWQMHWLERHQLLSVGLYQM